VLTRELDYWRASSTPDQIEPQPIIRAAIRWLRAIRRRQRRNQRGPRRLPHRQLPYEQGGRDPRRPRLGDGHLGDPLEDLGWGLTASGAGAATIAAAGFCRASGRRDLEKASGLKPIQRPALVELFNCVKGQGIWVSSAKAWSDGENPRSDPDLLRLAHAERCRIGRALELMGPPIREHAAPS